MMNRTRLKKAFSLIEMLVVLSIISVLAALLFPAFFTARGKAREMNCNSNLRQIGVGFSLYIQDSDGYYPLAVDPSDRAVPQAWSYFPQFEAAISNIGLIQTVLQPYVTQSTFQCPADFGFEIADFSEARLNATPSSFEKFGTSYYYRTELAARQTHESAIQLPTQINVLLDGAGQWHGTLFPLAPRYNILFADGHAKSQTRGQADQAWSTSLSSDS